MPDELISAVGLAIVYGAAALLGVFSERIERSEITRHWTRALACFALDETFDVVGRLTDWSTPFRVASWTMLLGAAFYTLEGTWGLLGWPASKWPRRSLLVVAAVVVLGGLLGLEQQVLRFIVFESLAVTLLWASRLIYKYVSPPGTGRGLTSFAFCAGGLYAACWPILAATPLNRRLEFFVVMSIVLCSAAGAFFLSFERARARIRELAQQELELRAKLEQSERLEALGRLAGGVAHDFNNVLTTVIHGSELVLKQIEDRPKAAESLRLVLESAQGAAQFTRQLLSLGRRRMPGRRPVQLETALTAALGMIRPTLPPHVKLVTCLPAQQLQVRAGEGQLEQIVVNLALNAMDAMSEGGTLSILTDVDERHSVLTLTVHDTGYGMSPEVLAHVFEPFFSTKSGRGSGLGLAAVYAIVKQLGGTIEVQSKLDEGTSFIVTLPCCEGTLPTSAPSSSRPLASEISILVVDDQPSVLFSVSQGLADEGYRVTTASSAAEALSMVGDSPPSVLLTDVCMPGTDGFELLHRLRRRFPGLPAILMTAYSNDAELESGRFDVHWLPKPFTRLQLRAAIDSALEHRKSEPARSGEKRLAGSSASSDCNL